MVNIVYAPSRPAKTFLYHKHPCQVDKRHWTSILFESLKMPITHGLLVRGWSNGRWPLFAFLSRFDISFKVKFKLFWCRSLAASYFCWLLTGFTLLSTNKLSSKQIWSNLNVSYLESAVFILVFINVTDVLIFKRTN